MLKQIGVVRCTHVAAQVILGFYDADGHLVGEEVYPQAEGTPLVARLFHPHAEELTSLIDTCVQQAWECLHARGQAGAPGAASNGSADNGNQPDEGGAAERLLGRTER